MDETLPSAIVTHLEQFGHALVAISREQADGTLAALEQAVLAAMRQWLPRWLEDVLQASQLSLQPGARAFRWTCPRCGAPGRVQSWRERTVRTVCGRVTFERPWGVCRTCRQGFSPTDGTLQLTPEARLSPGLQAWAITQGARLSFGEAAANLELLTGHKLSPETVREQTEARGQALRAEETAAIATVQQTQEAAEPVDPAPGDLIVETDGVMLRYRLPDRTTEWREVKVGDVFGYVDGALVAPSYVAAREAAEAFGPRLLAEAARRGALEILDWVGSPLRRQIARLRLVTVLADGAKWIWSLAAEHFDRRIEILDWYHASEHLWSIARTAFGEGTAAARDWVERQQRDLSAHGSAPLLAALRRVRADTAAGRQVLQVEKGYFRRNAARLEYPTFRALGLPIGSGAVESTAKHLIQQRLKLPGASWSTAGADGVMAVRCRLLSQRPLNVTPAGTAA